MADNRPPKRAKVEDSLLGDSEEEVVHLSDVVHPLDDVMCVVETIQAASEPVEAMKQLFDLVQKTPHLRGVLCSKGVVESFDVDIFWLMHLSRLIDFVDYLAQTTQRTSILVTFLRESIRSSDCEDGSEMLTSIATGIVNYIFEKTSQVDALLSGSGVSAHDIILSSILPVREDLDTAPILLAESDLDIISDILILLGSNVPFVSVELNEFHSLLLTRMLSMRIDAGSSAPDAGSVAKIFAIFQTLSSRSILKVIDWLMESDGGSILQAHFEPQSQREPRTIFYCNLFDLFLRYLVVKFYSSFGQSLGYDIPEATSPSTGSSIDEVLLHVFSMLNVAVVEELSDVLQRTVAFVCALADHTETYRRWIFPDSKDLAQVTRSGHQGDSLKNNPFLALFISVLLGSPAGNEPAEPLPNFSEDWGSISKLWLAVLAEREHLSLRYPMPPLRQIEAFHWKTHSPVRTTSQFKFVCIGFCEASRVQSLSAIHTLCSAIKARRAIDKDSVDLFLQSAAFRIKELETALVASEADEAAQQEDSAGSKSVLDFEAERLVSWIETFTRSKALPPGLAHTCTLLGKARGFKAILRNFQRLIQERPALTKACLGLVQKMAQQHLCPEPEARSFISQVQSRQLNRESFQASIQSLLSRWSWSTSRISRFVAPMLSDFSSINEKLATDQCLSDQSAEKIRPSILAAVKELFLLIPQSEGQEKSQIYLLLVFCLTNLANQLSIKIAEKVHDTESEGFITFWLRFLKSLLNTLLDHLTNFCEAFEDGIMFKIKLHLKQSASTLGSTSMLSTESESFASFAGIALLLSLVPATKRWSIFRNLVNPSTILNLFTDPTSVRSGIVHYLQVYRALIGLEVQWSAILNVPFQAIDSSNFSTYSMMSSKASVVIFLWLDDLFSTEFKDFLPNGGIDTFSQSTLANAIRSSVTREFHYSYPSFDTVPSEVASRFQSWGLDMAALSACFRNQDSESKRSGKASDQCFNFVDRVISSPTENFIVIGQLIGRKWVDEDMEEDFCIEMN